eukprot:TRINITY_DN24367_c0_g1_i1.p1 TRINITY_DN24367_c0_g1~~TRINITY_DN24367_c0_g1_i1.p1  ORF type:complete len:245 (+),score=73.70 TRINITY_DN24367_c0_g1_i1:332-1066(+)
MQESPNVNLAQSLTMSANYDKMKQDLESLQEKIKNLETKLGSSSRSDEGKFAIQKREEKPLLMKELSLESYKENLVSESTKPEVHSAEAPQSSPKRSSKKRKERTYPHRAETTMSDKGATPSKSSKKLVVENTNYKKLYEAIKAELAKEKRTNKELKNKLRQYESQRQDKGQEKMKEEFEQLRLAYTKSEELRKKQKEVISKLRKDTEKSKTGPITVSAITVTAKPKKKLVKKPTKSKLPKKSQ